MPKKRILKEYKDNVNFFKKCAKDRGLSDQDINSILAESFIKLKAENQIFSSERGSRCQNALKISLCTLLFLSLFIYILLNVHTPTSSIVLRNVQGLTYPALKIVRTLSLPIIQLFPSLTELYDETCLIKNPFFYLTDLDCSPCENVHSVIDLTGVPGVNAYEKVTEGTPLVLKTFQKLVSWRDLQELYVNHPKELMHESSHLDSNLQIANIHDLFALTETNLTSKAHIKWRINEMTAARTIRKLFPKPYFFPPMTGQDVERFIFIDGPLSEAYTLPNTECSYVFMIQGSGERKIMMKPARECVEKCKTVSVLLKPSYVLLYNWWYWRPVSLPGNVNPSLSISYINSHC
ncbi:hypothetical protein ABEB36_005447 [Hypothenemus hampei]|uniref:Uncharacterized protein n=1 Tax=Hypothenemus hampei TaxID=57062 RepID=A0ABD1EY88_HYPHA